MILGAVDTDVECGRCHAMAQAVIVLIPSAEGELSQLDIGTALPPEDPLVRVIPTCNACLQILIDQLPLVEVLDDRFKKKPKDPNTIN